MNNVTKSKFRGVMMGALVGDCLGAEFESITYQMDNMKFIEIHFKILERPHDKGAKLKRHTDDTAMMKNVAATLILKQPVDYITMAKLFAEEYYRDPNRLYGAHVRNIFHTWRAQQYSNILEPAMKQFGGEGSCGNGGAMRIAPVALYYNNYEEMIRVAKASTQLTHTHRMGVYGAVLQCIAVREALTWNGDLTYNPKPYIDKLIERLNEVDSNAVEYVRKLELIKGYLIRNLRPDTFVQDEEIIINLGTSLLALESVPTAIYCFVQAHQGFPGINSDNVYRRAIQYAVSLGEGTNTIASMAGAIAGAYFGEEGINANMIDHCEFKAEMLQLADRLYDLRKQD